MRERVRPLQLQADCLTSCVSMAIPLLEHDRDSVLTEPVLHRARTSAKVTSLRLEH